MAVDKTHKKSLFLVTRLTQFFCYQTPDFFLPPQAKTKSQAWLSRGHKGHWQNKQTKQKSWKKPLKTYLPTNPSYFNHVARNKDSPFSPPLIDKREHIIHHGSLRRSWTCHLESSTRWTWTCTQRGSSRGVASAMVLFLELSTVEVCFILNACTKTEGNAWLLQLSLLLFFFKWIQFVHSVVAFWWGFFLACEDFLRMLNHSFPAGTFFFFLIGD